MNATQGQTASRATGLTEVMPLQAKASRDTTEQLGLTQLASDLSGMPLLIPVPRAAELLGISRSAAYRCAASGDLPTTHLGGRVYVVTARLQSLLESA